MHKRVRILTFSLITLLIICAGCNLPISVTKTQESTQPSVSTELPAVTETPAAAASVEATTAAATQVPAQNSPLCVSFIDASGNLYAWTAGAASPIELVSSGDVINSYVSPDGSLIAYTRSTDYSSYELDVINADGSNQRTLVSRDQFAALPRPDYATGLAPNKIEWKPGSHILAMNLQAILEGPGLMIPETLYTLDADSGTLSQLLTAGDGFSFSYSSDGNYLTVSRPNGIDLYTAAGTGIAMNVVTYESINTASEYAWTATPAWQNNSSAFAAVIPPVEPWVDSPAPSLVWKVNSTGSAETKYSGEMSFFPGGIASFSPDLSSMGYRTRLGAPADNQWTLHVANIDGSGDRMLDSGYFSQLPTWSPDGQAFIYAKLVDSTNEAYLVTGSSTPVRLTDIVSLLSVRWVDETHYIAASHTSSGESLLYGTVGGATGVIFNGASSSNGKSLTFDLNR